MVAHLLIENNIATYAGHVGHFYDKSSNEIRDQLVQKSGHNESIAGFLLALRGLLFVLRKTDEEESLDVRRQVIILLR